MGFAVKFCIPKLLPVAVTPDRRNLFCVLHSTLAPRSVMDIAIVIWWCCGAVVRRWFGGVFVGCCWLAVGCLLLVVGCWLLVVGCWLLVIGCWLWWWWLLVVVVGGSCWLLLVVIVGKP